MKNLNLLAFAGLLPLLLCLLRCASEAPPAPSPPSPVQSTLVGIKSQATEAEAYAFFSFLQALQQERDPAADRQLHRAATQFFPDSTRHPDFDLYGLEISFCDSIRLLYYEYSRPTPPEHHPYLGVFTKAGRPLSILSLQEAAWGGYAAVNLIDGQTIEVESYEVYDAEGYYQDQLHYDYYRIDSLGQLYPLTRPQRSSEGRRYVEASWRLLSRAELAAYRPEALTHMQQELLAEYGQIFTQRKWQRYFERQDWYHPRTREAEAQLSGLETVNLATIRALLKAY